ncbi:MAG: hypothetical protein ACXVBH_10665 [Flavisolibacter sp.]
MKTIVSLTLCFLLSVGISNAQDYKSLLRDFPNYTVDTFHIMGNPVMVKRGVIAIQMRDGIKSAYWDETNAILTIQYDDKMVRLRDIKNYFYYNLQPRGGTNTVRIALDY